MCRERRPPILLSLAVVTLVAISGISDAQETPSSVVGTWSLELEIDGRTVPSQLSVWEEGGALHASWSGPRGASELDDVRFSDGTLRFVREMSVQGQPMHMSFSGRVEGDALRGSLSTPRGELQLSGRRISTQPAAAGGQAALESSGAGEGDGPLPASALPVEEAAGFLGAWALQMSFQGNPVQMDLELTDRDGKLAALLATPQGEQAITDIGRTEDGLELRLDSGIGRLVMLARLEQGRLVGTVGDAAGSFSTEFSGSRAATGEAGSRARRARMRSGRPLALLLVGEHEVKVYYADPPASEEELARLAEAAEGSVIAFPDHAAIKLMTELDLDFGGETVRYGNVSPSYPGVYSLWLRKGAGEQWRLVFNAQADVWGTMHDPAHDVAEVSLEHAALDVPAESLAVGLEERDGGGELVLSWGPHRWSVPFVGSVPAAAEASGRSLRSR